ncbi:MAG TPA: glycosyltransferase family 39 protein [Chitinophagales bacterium]|nr:glycosyltransferase family 39 protein [Chitinophagales bacterium]
MVAVAYGINLFVDVMQVDAAQYAAMSWEMFTTKNYLQVLCLKVPYLDKPPLLFWLNTLSFKLLGINNAAYKLSSLLFMLLGIYSTYRFARLFFSENTARLSALMLATTQAAFLITNDVRTDTLLLGAVMFSIWQLAEYFETGRPLNIFLGGVGVGLALLSKGPIGLIACGAALLPYVVIKKKINLLLNWKILLPVFIMALMLLPMCIALYQQWGGKGLKFYFWTQSFGRITGESEWNNHPDTFFLVHTTIWAFMPWSIFLFAGWFSGLYHAIKYKLQLTGSGELITLSGFTLVLIALMLSKYQLPHYIFVVYPLGAVIAANYLQKLFSVPGNGKWAVLIQAVLLLALVAISVLLQYAFKGIEPFSVALLILLYPALIFAAIKLNGPVKDLRTAYVYTSQGTANFVNSIKGKKARGLTAKAAAAFDIAGRNIVGVSAAVAIAFNVLMGAFYYTAIIKYQPENDFGRYIAQHPDKHLVLYCCTSDFALAFYARQYMPEPVWDIQHLNDTLAATKNLLVITNNDRIGDLDKGAMHYQIIEQHAAFKISGLTLPFLNPATRESVCKKMYLLEIDKPR